jgi:ribosomal protein S18 acetylase RimI-like enzyme
VSDHRVHRNLIDSSRQLFELDPDAAVLAEDGAFLGAGSSSHPAISNVAFRYEDDRDPEQLIARSRDFFGARNRGFSLWVRGDQAEDADLAAAAAAAGMQMVYAMPEMVLGTRVEASPLPRGAELREVTEESQAEDYWRIAAESYLSLGFPEETFAGYTDHAGMLAGNLAAFIGYLDGDPVSIAMTIVSHDVAGIYWVGSLERARGQGLGRAVTVAATNAGFEKGAEIASLQASPMGKPIYVKLGYQTVFDYRLLISPQP